METQGEETSQSFHMEMGEPQPYVSEKAASVLGKQDKGHGLEQLADKSLQEAGKIAEGVRELVLARLSHQKDRAAATLSTMGAAIRRAGEDPRQLGQTPVAPLTAQAAERVEQVSTYLRRRDLTALSGEIERIARTQPPLFVACALATGWLAARFLKSRIPDETEQSAIYATGMPYTVVLPGSR